jgi:hypothetical protein
LSSLRKGRFFIQEIADKTQLNKNRFELFLSFFKRDIIIFSGLLLAIFNILEFLPPVFLIIFLTLFIIGVMKYFLQQSKRGLN